MPSGVLIERGEGLALAAAALIEQHDVVADRKSTRLNSSHSQISYAVFCLKKKKHHPSVHYAWIGSARMAEGKFADARAAYEQVIASAPTLFSALDGLAFLEPVAGRTSAAD